jgi:uncharacterized lipoprotein YehR (DUF1307 family)
MKKILLIVLSVILVMTMVGCESEAQKVSYNLSQEADNFNVVRQLTVIDCITGDVLFQMTGKISIKADTADNQLEVTVEDENGNYQKHFVGLSDNVTYVVEQLRGKNVDKYKYVLNYNPKMWIPIGFDNID